MTRKLSDEDRTLWERIRASVKPLRRARVAKRVEAAPAPEQAAVRPPPSKRVKPPKAAPVAAAPPATPTKAPPALTGLEDRTRRKLGRGQVAVDATIDLHGMRQERAFAALAGFLQAAQARGDRIVLVVTGKGGGAPGEGRDGRGVLRQSVPNWLARPDLRPLVIGFEEAGRLHGGAGALYVRVRRRRASRSSAAGA